MSKLRCRTHGPRVAAVVCGHMLAETEARVGFVENSDDPDDLQAWCDACEEMFLAEGDKTPAFRELCKIAVVCDRCYADLARRHSIGTAN